MSAQPVARPSLADQMPTYADLLVMVDDLMRDKEHALYTLHCMRGNGIYDIPKLEQAIRGARR